MIAGSNNWSHRKRWLLIYLIHSSAIKRPGNPRAALISSIAIKPYPIGVKIVFFVNQILYTFKKTITPYTVEKWEKSLLSKLLLTIGGDCFYGFSPLRSPLWR